MNVLLVLKSWTAYQYFAFRLLVSLVTGKRRNSTEYRTWRVSFAFLLCVLPALTATSGWNGQAVQVVYISSFTMRGVSRNPSSLLVFHRISTHGRSKGIPVHGRHFGFPCDNRQQQYSRHAHFVCSPHSDAWRVSLSDFAFITKL